MYTDTTVRVLMSHIEQLEAENEKLKTELDFTKQFIIDNDMQWALLSEYDKWKKARGE